MSKVLIVDDEPHLRLLYETELRRSGFETMTASNAIQGLEFVETMKPDLVVLDIRMAGMDGECRPRKSGTRRTQGQGK